jgi:hypothetical protein
MGTRRSFVLITAMIAVGGCGGSGKGARPQAPATSRTASSQAAVVLSRAQLVEHADAICERLNVEFTAAKPARQSVHEIARLSPQRAMLEHDAVAELEKLKPPASIARDWQAIVAYRRTLANELAALGRYARLNDVLAIRRLAVSKERVHRKLRAAATAAGFNSCSLVG